MADTALVPPTDGIRLPERTASVYRTSDTASAADARTTRFRTLGLVVVFVTQLMLVVDASIVNVALPDIQKALGFTPVGLSWS